MIRVEENEKLNHKIKHRKKSCQTKVKMQKRVLGGEAPIKQKSGEKGMMRLENARGAPVRFHNWGCSG